LSSSALMYFIGVKRKLNGILHHNLLFENDNRKHPDQKQSNPLWPDEPSIYVTCSSKSDKLSAPEGCENLVVLIPVPNGLDANQEIREKYFQLFIEKFQSLTGEEIRNDIIYLKSFANDDFVSEYNSFKGNAYGLSNTRRQIAILKPSIRSKKLSNLFYAGQLTIPGPGVPQCIVSGQVAATEILKRV
jgi:phytoene desaturase